MLILTRRLHERIVIGDDVVVTVLDIDREGSVLIGVDAPRHVRVDRLEVRRRVDPGWCRPDRRPSGRTV